MRSPFGTTPVEMEMHRQGREQSEQRWIEPQHCGVTAEVLTGTPVAGIDEVPRKLDHCGGGGTLLLLYVRQADSSVKGIPILPEVHGGKSP